MSYRRTVLAVLAALAIAALSGCNGGGAATTAAGAAPGAAPTVPLGHQRPPGHQARHRRSRDRDRPQVLGPHRRADVRGPVGQHLGRAPDHRGVPGRRARRRRGRRHPADPRHLDGARRAHHRRPVPPGPGAAPHLRAGHRAGCRHQDAEDLRGKKIAYSPGQAQGALVLRVLKAAGLTKEDVELVELPSTGDVYSTALACRQVDVAPVGGVQVKRYLAKYGTDGATTISHGLRDDPSTCTSPRPRSTTRPRRRRCASTWTCGAGPGAGSRSTPTSGSSGTTSRTRASRPTTPAM